MLEILVHGQTIKGCHIDDLADQILTFNALPTNINVGYGITQGIPANAVVAGSGTTSLLTGYFKGVTQVDTNLKQVSVKILESVTDAGVSTSVSYQQIVFTSLETQHLRYTQVVQLPIHNFTNRK